MTALRTFVYLLVGPSEVIASEQQTLADLDTAVGRAAAVGATSVLVHAGYERMSDDQARLHLLSAPQGIWLTASAASIRPAEWLPAAKALPNPVKKQEGRNRPGRKVDPNSARYLAREIYQANWEKLSDREIKHLMVEQLNIDSRVANVYFIDFRKEMGHVSSRERARAEAEAEA